MSAWPRRHRSALALCALVAVPCLVANGARAEPMGQVSLSDGITVRGMTTLVPESLGRPLAADDDLLLLSRPLGNRKLFLSALARKATLALERAGFATPKVVASIEPTGAGSGERIVVDVVEGPRALAAGIEVRGFPDDVAAGLKRWLQAQRPPVGAIGVAVESGDGWGGERFFDDQGRRSRMEPPLWRRDEPACFDAPRLAELRAQISRYLREQGYFASARLLDPKKPAGFLGGLAALAAGTRPASSSLDVAVKPGPDAGTATLVVTGTDLPARSVLRDVTLPEGSRISPETLVDALGIVIGGPVSDRDRDGWRRRLYDSGRFVTADVVLDEVPAGADGVPGIVARFAFEEYLPATPFGSAASREEETMLRFRTWLTGALAGGADVVATWQRDSTPNAAATPAGSIVLAPSRGMLVAALPGGADACGMAVSADGLGWFFPRGGGRFETALPSDGRMTAKVSLSVSRTSAAAKDAPPSYDRQLSLGAGFESGSGSSSSAFDLAVRVDPVACVALVHEKQPRLRWEEGVLVIEGDDWVARFDERSGRPLGFTASSTTVRLDAGVGRFEELLGALRTAAGDDRADPERLVSSATAFFTDDAAVGAFETTLHAAGIPGSIAPLRRYGPLLTAARRVAAAGELEPLDRLAAAITAATDDDDDDLEIPSDKPSPADPIMLVGRLAATQAWRIAERECGRDRWPAGLARLAALALAQDPLALEELSTFMTSDGTGPLASLVAASGVPMPLVKVTLARRGQDRLSAEAFRADYRPLLSAANRHGLDRTAVALARALGDDEVTTLGRLACHDEAFLVPLVSHLRAAPTVAAATGALPDALDHWWTVSLRDFVAAALADIVAPRTAGKPGDAAPVR